MARRGRRHLQHRAGPPPRRLELLYCVPAPRRARLARVFPLPRSTCASCMDPHGVRSSGRAYSCRQWRRQGDELKRVRRCLKPHCETSGTRHTIRGVTRALPGPASLFSDANYHVSCRGRPEQRLSRLFRVCQANLGPPGRRRFEVWPSTVRAHPRPCTSNMSLCGPRSLRRLYMLALWPLAALNVRRIAVGCP